MHEDENEVIELETPDGVRGAIALARQLLEQARVHNGENMKSEGD